MTLDVRQQQQGWPGLLGRLVAAPDTKALPERVAEIVRREDRDSERLVAVAQLGIAGLLWALYLAAPRPDDAVPSSLAPVPLALGLYTVFSILRLRLILRRPVRGLLVAVSIVADVALVLALIWSFHIEYGQPPGFSLKAPTFVYLLVLIVLRSLRFDPRYVLAAGLAAALGWGLLTVLAISLSPEGAVTRSFVAYVNGSRILIGAEIDKIVAILAITGLLALGARRAQRTLVAAVREEAAAREIGRFLSRGVAEQIAGSDLLIEAGHAEAREAAILMIDIRGFTAFAAKETPRAVVGVLNSFHSRVVPLVRAHGGVVDKFLGDGVMATFGAARVSPTAAADALRALDRLLEEAVQWQQDLAERGIGAHLQVNAAVAAGPVVFAALGSGDRLELTVIGEAANLAAKLEKHNKVEGSLAVVPAATLALATAQGYVPANPFAGRPAARIAGLAEPLDIVVRLA
jgi:adenylate cyclase